MNTAKHLNSLNSQALRKKGFNFWDRTNIIIVFLATILCTLIDWYLVKQQVVEFPVRPFSRLFSVNILQALVGLPLIISVFMYCLSQVSMWGRKGIILFFSLLLPVFERSSEEFGVFKHSERWEHIYTFLGSLLLFSLINRVYLWKEAHKLK